MPRWLYALLLFVPAAIVARLIGLSDLAVFGLSAAGLVPLAGLIGKATEELAGHLGPRAGGLLNATFGNAAELIITGFAIGRGLLPLAKASITGSIIGNILLVIGVSFLAGGARHGRLQFDPRETGINSAMMLLAVAGLYLPAIFATAVPEHFIVEELSVLVAAVLLGTYLAYLMYTVLQGHPRTAAAAEAGGERKVGRAGAGKGGWGVGMAVGVLAAATVGAAVSSELLVGAVETVTRQLGWSEFFVGVIVVAVIGNAAEHFSAVQMALDNRIDVSLAIAAGSSTQIALFVAPVLIFVSLLLGHPMNLIFRPLELAILGLSVVIFAYISADGESNWLEGAQLLALYAIAAFAFFFMPLNGQG